MSLRVLLACSREREDPGNKQIRPGTDSQGCGRTESAERARAQASSASSGTRRSSQIDESRGKCASCSRIYTLLGTSARQEIKKQPADENRHLGSDSTPAATKTFGTSRLSRPGLGDHDPSGCSFLSWKARDMICDALHSSLRRLGGNTAMPLQVVDRSPIRLE